MLNHHKAIAQVSAVTINGLRFKIARKLGCFMLTQAELAKLLDIHRTTLCHYENLRRRPAPYIEHRIIVRSKKYGIDLTKADFDPQSRFKLSYFQKIQSYIKALERKRYKKRYHFTIVNKFYK